MNTRRWTLHERGIANVAALAVVDAALVLTFSGVEAWVVRFGAVSTGLVALYAAFVRPIVKGVGRIVDRLESIETLASAVASLSVRVGVVEDRLDDTTERAT